jgi:RNA polymerase sigma-70 factor (family 1)
MKAYRSLYNLFYKPLHRFSKSFVRSDEVAEEIVSDVFVKLWDIRARLVEIRHLKVYLFIIAKNFSLNHLVRQRNIPVVSLDAADIDAVLTQPDPETACVSNDLVLQIKAELNKLPPQARIIFQLVREDGFSYKDAAAILGISPLTVRNQLAIAVRKIAATFPAYLYPAIYRRDLFSKS